MDHILNYGIMHVTSEAVLMAKRVYALHLQRYTKEGEALLSQIRPNSETPSPFEEYVSQCSIRYDFIHASDEEYPGFETVILCFIEAFATIYKTPLGEN